MPRARQRRNVAEDGEVVNWVVSNPLGSRLGSRQRRALLWMARGAAKRHGQRRPPTTLRGRPQFLEDLEQLPLTERSKSSTLSWPRTQTKGPPRGGEKP